MKTFSPADIEVNVTEIVDILRNGGVIVAPSDTCYGLIVDATSRKAVEKLLLLKERPPGKAVSVFVNGIPMMEKYVDTSKLTATAKELLPGPYTIVLPSLGKLVVQLEAEDATIGIRYVDNTLINRIVDIFGAPVTATSANISGKSPAYSPSAFLNQLSHRKSTYIDAIIDAGELPHNPPSTVISFTSTTPEVIRASTQNYIYRKLYRSGDIMQTGEVATDVRALLDKFATHKAVVILLDGELGSGKTTWTKFFAKTYGLTRVVSPTYNYENEYTIICDTERHKIFRHFDLYNVATLEDVENLKLGRCLDVESINVIEWPSQINKRYLEYFVHEAYLMRIHFEYIDETMREITVYHN